MFLVPCFSHRLLHRVRLFQRGISEIHRYTPSCPRATFETLRRCERENTISNARSGVTPVVELQSRERIVLSYPENLFFFIKRSSNVFIYRNTYCTLFNSFSKSIFIITSPLSLSLCVIQKEYSRFE